MFTSRACIIFFNNLFLFIYFYHVVVALGRRCSRLERDTQVTSTRTRTGRRCGVHKSVDPSILPTTENWDWGYVTPLRVVYYQIRVAGTFPTPSQCSQRMMLFRQVKISCYATKGNERRQSARMVKRRDPANMDAVQRASQTGDFSRNGDGEGRR